MCSSIFLVGFGSGFSAKVRFLCLYQTLLVKNAQNYLYFLSRSYPNLNKISHLSSCNLTILWLNENVINMLITTPESLKEALIKWPKMIQYVDGTLFKFLLRKTDIIIIGYKVAWLLVKGLKIRIQNKVGSSSVPVFKICSDPHPVWTSRFKIPLKSNFSLIIFWPKL